MAKQIRHDTGLVSRAYSLHSFFHAQGCAAILLFLAVLSPCAAAQTAATGSAQPLANLPDAPQSLVAQSPIPTQDPANPQPSSMPQPQSASASIRGVVVNPDGAVYEGVHLILTQRSPAFERSTTSDTNGRFQFTDLSAGSFQLTVSSNGFVTQIINGALHPGENYEIPAVTLPVASTTTEVEVTASRFEVAQEQLHEEEQQRVLGIVPNFWVVYAPNAAPLSSKQKFHLAWRSMIDPVTIGIDVVTAAIQQDSDDYKGFGQGTAGYAKRFGAAYANDFTATMLGGAILPSLLKQDPRYFYKGTGTVRSRTLYAISRSVICKSDKGRWQPNYSSILGGLAAGGIANLYYPAEDRNGAALTFENASLGIGVTAIQNVFQEFVVRKLTPKLPSYKPAKP